MASRKTRRTHETYRRTYRTHKTASATSAVALSVALLIAGCSNGDSPTGTTGQAFREGTLSSDDSTNPAESTGGFAEDTGGSTRETLLRVEGGERTRFSGLCTTDDREYVIGGSPARTYSFEERSFSCRIQKQDPESGNLKVTVISGDSTRSVQQTSADGGIVNVSYEPSGDSP